MTSETGCDIIVRMLKFLSILALFVVSLQANYIPADYPGLLWWYPQNYPTFTPICDGEEFDYSNLWGCRTTEIRIINAWGAIQIIGMPRVKKVIEEEYTPPYNPPTITPPYINEPPLYVPPANHPQAAVVPEPAFFWLTGSAFIVLVLLASRKRVSS